MELVSNEPLRTAFWASGLSLYEVAARARMDDTSVGRALGVTKLTDKRRSRSYLNKRMSYETAVKLCRALGVDPVDVGV